MVNNKNNLIELFEKREKLEGTRIYRMILGLADSQYIVNQNYQELYQTISEYEKNGLILMAVENRQKFESAL